MDYYRWAHNHGGHWWGVTGFGVVWLEKGLALIADWGYWDAIRMHCSIIFFLGLTIVLGCISQLGYNPRCFFGYCVLELEKDLVPGTGRRHWVCFSMANTMEVA